MGGMDVKLAIFSCDKLWGDQTMKLVTLILMSVVALTSISIVRAETVDQIGTFAPVTYTGLQAALSQNDLGASLPNLPNFATAFENFTFTSSGVISSFSWIGEYESLSPGPLPVGGPNFQINFYTSLGATAGSAIPVATFNLLAADTNQIALTGSNTGFFSYTTTGTPFNVIGGTTYFTSIIAQMDYAIAGWGLAFSNLGNNLSTQDFGDTSLTRFNDTIDYAISVTAVPEPGTLVILASVGGVFLIRRRFVSKQR